MDDLQIEMQAIREFVVERLSEFRSELSSMNQQIKSCQEKSDTLNQSFKDISTRYNVRQDQMEDTFHSSSAEQSTSSKRPLSDSEDDEDFEMKTPTTLEELPPGVRKDLGRDLQQITVLERQRKGDESTIIFHPLLDLVTELQ